MIKELLEGKKAREVIAEDKEFKAMMDAETGGRHAQKKTVASVNGIEMDETELMNMALDFGVDIEGKTHEEIAMAIENEIKEAGE